MAERHVNRRSPVQQIVNVWNALETRRKVIVILATLAMLAAVIGLARMAGKPSLTLLYSGLENGAAGEVVRALDQRGVVYEVRGGAIFVAAAQRDTLRMTLASEGLPANTAKGYELLDGLSGFGTTAQMFDAAYWRAKEGELARTILAGPGITSARVHIANAGGNPFRRDLRPSASVSVTTAGGALPPAQARALRYLVAAAVSGLLPEDVTIVDGTGAIVAGTEAEAPSNTAEDRGAALRDKVQRLLEARVGPGNAVVEVTLETLNESESIREKRFDPQGRVAISTETEESSDSAQNAGGGEVTVASNLPDGEAGGGNQSNSQNSRTRERVNYEVSETEREIQRAAGAIKRLTVAVLVNGANVPADDGTAVSQPRPDEELAALRDLVASAVGYDETRGDVITLKSMAFEPISPLGTAATPGMLDRLALDAMSLIQMAVLAVVALLLGLFVVRPVLSGRQATAAAALPAPARAAPSPQSEALTGEIEDEDGNFIPAMSSGAGATGTALSPANPGAQSDAVERLRALIGERQDETVEILRTWLEDEEPTR
ncbi:flagellar basal-body MS-ring/collar protein FliF [Lacimonas salitolerans]|uniref:Flagellar M-ring protein n=1 Tax=Lacimonas salitolerans TaxID=1323750 RepID=A0ABW4EFG1_9RHOB